MSARLQSLSTIMFRSTISIAEQSTPYIKINPMRSIHIEVNGDFAVLGSGSDGIACPEVSARHVFSLFSNYARSLPVNKDAIDKVAM